MLDENALEQLTIKYREVAELRPVFALAFLALAYREGLTEIVEDDAGPELAKQLLALGTETIPVGTLVRFAPKVFEAPYAPHYNHHRGLNFRVEYYLPEDVTREHVMVQCMATGEMVCCHDHELEVVL